MADEKPMGLKYAMADVLALFIIALFTFLVAGLGLDANGGQVVASVALPCAIAMFIATYIAFVNDNLLGTAIFGPLAVFFLTFYVMNTGIFGALPGVDTAMLLGFMAIVIFVDAIVAFAQPVKLLPILLLVAAVAFLVTALYYNSPDDSLKLAFGILWLIYTLISLYMAPAIMILVMKGKPMLPLLISKK